VNNAGIIGMVGPIADISRNDLEDVLAINLVAPFLLSRAALPAMLARKYGRIVNVASIAGKEGNPNLIPYSVSKAALIALTKSLAKEVAGKGDITVNSISPAVIHTPMMDALPAATQEYMVSRVPLGRPGTSEEVAALVHYLASSDASFSTGQCYDISGGRATY
jgi:3-oxoacyl-[acyl-carrier protein] reductase